MELTIYTYGHIDAMFYLLNGIAMFMNHGFTTRLVEFMAIVSTAYYGLMMAYSGSSHQHKLYIGKIAAMILMINAAILPTTDMTIIDHVSKKRDTVSNLPLGFAVPVGILEAFGDILTGGFEQAFTGGNTSTSASSNSANFRDYGMVFGARLIAESQNWRIHTPEFQQNMHEFLRRCVIRDAAMGSNYTIQDLLTSNNIWQLVSTNTSGFRKVAMRKNKSLELVNCKEAAANYITPAFASEIEGIQRRSRHEDFASANPTDTYSPRQSQLLNNMLSRNIELVFGSHLGSTTSAENILKQQMILNALSDVTDQYGYARASAQQESSWMIAGDLANTYLPILLTVIKGLVYASFIFMVPLMLLSGGGHKYMSYLTLVASLQLWPALSSILNMFIDLYSTNALSAIADGVVSFATFSKIGRYADKIVAVASGLQISIPFLSFAIVQGGVGSFIHLANNITGASQSAASSAAAEVTSGNRNLDNHSLGNMQVAMQTGFKTDWNQNYAAGASSYQHSDGIMEKVLQSGETILQSGAGLTNSGGTVAFNIRESSTAELNQGLSRTESLMQSQQRAYNQASQSTFDKTASLVSELAQREQRGETIDYSEAGEYGSSLQKTVSEAKNLHKDHNYSWEQASNAALRASLSASTPGQGVLSIGIAGSAEKSQVNSNTTSQAVSSSDQTNRESGISDNYQNVIRAAMSEQFTKSNHLDTSHSSDIRRSYNQQKSLEKQLAIRHEEIDTYNKALAHIESHGASYDRDVYHQLEHNVAKENNVSLQDAHRMIESNHPKVILVKQAMINDQVSLSLQPLAAGRARISESSEQMNNFDHAHENKINRNPKESMEEYAPQFKLNEKNHNEVEENLKSHSINTRARNHDIITEARHEAAHKENALTNEVIYYDNDRVRPIVHGGGPNNPLIDTNTPLVYNSANNNIVAKTTSIMVEKGFADTDKDDDKK